MSKRSESINKAKHIFFPSLITMASKPIPCNYEVKENFDHIKSGAEFIEIYEKKSLNDNNTNKFLNNYLISCFMNKKTDHVKTIIRHFDLDTSSNTIEI